MARLTADRGVLRAFSGVRLARVSGDRAPDLRLRASPEQLARALTGASPIAALVTAGKSPALVDALTRAAAVVAGDARLRARLEAAAGAAP